MDENRRGAKIGFSGCPYGEIRKQGLQHYERGAHVTSFGLIKQTSWRAVRPWNMVAEAAQVPNPSLIK